MNSIPLWDVKEKITNDCRVIVQLTCNGRVVHELSGSTAKKTLTDYAKLMNDKGAEEPPPKTRIGADGFRFGTPAKKVPGNKTVIPSMREWAKKHGLV